MTLLGTFQDIQQVIILVHEGRSLDEIERMDRKRTQRAMLANADQRGGSSAVINDISWEGLQLDSEVRVQLGTAVLNAIEKAHLVSINANVQFKLKSDYAKSFWPYIDSQPNHSYIDEDPPRAARWRQHEYPDQRPTISVSQGLPAGIQ